MALDKTIKELAELQELLPKGWLGKYVPSVGLGIEALKLTERLRKEQGNEYLLLLPGETNIPENG